MMSERAPVFSRMRKLNIFAGGFWIKKCVKLLHLSPGHISFKKRFIKIENYHGSHKNGTIKVQWCRACWWTRAAVPVTGGPFFSGLPPGRGSYVPGGNRNGCHRGGNRTCLQAWLTISGEHGAALTPPPEVTSVSSWGGGATVIRMGGTGRTAAAPCVFGFSTPQTSRGWWIIQWQNYSRCRAVTGRDLVSVLCKERIVLLAARVDG